MAVINGSTSSSNWTYRLDVYNMGAPNINDNTSVMRVDAWMGRATGTSRSWVAGNWSGHISINWETSELVRIPISGTIKYQTWLNPGEWYHMATVDFTVKHEDDGSKSIRVTSEISPTDFTPSYCVADGWTTLVTIPRATSLPAISSAYVEDTVTLNLSPKINNAKHSVKLTIPNSNNILFPKDSKWLQANGSLGSNEVLLSDKTLQMVIDSSYYKQFDGGSLSRVGLWLYTYNNNTFVDSDLEYIKLSCSPSRCTPVIDATVVDTNEVTLALTNDPNTIVANASKALVTPTIQISDPDDTNAWVTSKSINGTVFTTDTAIMYGPSEKDFLLSVTNNRGFTTNKTVSATGKLIPYIKLTFNIDSLYRPEPTGSEVILKYSGKFYSGEFATGVPNELTLWWKYKANRDSEYIDGGTLTPTIDVEKNTYSGEVTLGDIFDYQNQYDFQFFYKDKLVGINNDVFEPGSVTRGIPVYWWTADSFHIQGDLYVEGQINPTN